MAGLVDLEILSTKDDEIQAKVAVSDALKQPLGLVHGGVFATIADLLTAHGGRAISNQTSFIRPITEGTIHATARRRHDGRTTAVWEVEISDERARLCALVRVTVAKPGSPDFRGPSPPWPAPLADRPGPEGPALRGRRPIDH